MRHFLIFLFCYLFSISAKSESILAAEQMISSGAPLMQYQKFSPHPLYPYLQYAYYRNNLATTDPNEIVNFLKDNPRAPFADKLALSAFQMWLPMGRNDLIIQAYQPSFPSVENECIWRQALLNTGKKQEAANDIERIWNSAKNITPACDPLITNLATQGLITQDLVIKRFINVMANGDLSLASYLRPAIRKLEEQNDADIWISVRRNVLPISSLSSIRSRRLKAAAIGDLSARRTKEELYALTDLILKEGPSGVFLETTSREVIAKGLSRVSAKLAQANDQRTEQVFDLIPKDHREKNAVFDFIAYELRMKRYEQLAQHLQKLGNTEGNEAEYQYWIAKSLEKIGRNNEANSYYRMAAAKRDFFGFLAAEKLSIPININDRPVLRDATYYPRIMSYPETYRYRTFIRLGDLVRADEEFKAMTAKLQPEEVRQAALLAAESGGSFTAITLLAKHKDWDALTIRFPLRYEMQVKNLASKHGISPAAIFAIIRKESTFRPAIKSSAGAVGLMQVMPATAKHTADKYAIPYSGSHQLTNPDVNLEIGSKYLANMIERYGHLAYAAAAYNAGPNRVVQWQEANPGLSLDEWIAQIPFYETRDYVKRVLEYERIYEYRLNMPYVPYTKNPAIRFW